MAQTAEANINEDKSAVEMKEDELVGLPKSMIDRFAKVEGKQGYRLVPLKKQEIPKLLKLLQKDSSRKKIDYAKGMQNKDKNVPLIE